MYPTEFRVPWIVTLLKDPCLSALVPWNQGRACHSQPERSQHFIAGTTLFIVPHGLHFYLHGFGELFEFFSCSLV